MQKERYTLPWRPKKTKKCRKKYSARWQKLVHCSRMCPVPRPSQASTKFPKTKRDAIACASTKEHNYLNFAETRSPKPSRLTHTSLSHHSPCKLSLLARVRGRAVEEEWQGRDKPYDH